MNKEKLAAIRQQVARGLKGYEQALAIYKRMEADGTIEFGQTGRDASTSLEDHRNSTVISVLDAKELLAHLDKLETIVYDILNLKPYVHFGGYRCPLCEVAYEDEDVEEGVLKTSRYLSELEHAPGCIVTQIGRLDE